MDVVRICEIVVVVLTSCLSYYLYIRGEVIKKAEKAIADAEQTNEIGEEKMNLAVDQVYSLIPIGVKPFFPKFVLRKIIQQIFDRIEKFAKKS